MKENPIISNKYIALQMAIISFALAIVYCCSFDLSTLHNIDATLIDCIASFIAFAVVGTVLWNIITFAIPASLHITIKAVYYAVFGVAAAAIVTGIESLVVYAVCPAFIAPFALVLPARALFIVSIYAIYCILLKQYLQTEAQENPDFDTDFIHSDNEIANTEVDSDDTVKPNIEHITVKTGQKIKMIQVDDIICIKAEDDYISLITSDGRWLKNYTMKSISEELPDDKFVRIHRSYIVNITKIVNIERYGQKQQLLLTNGDKIRISATGYKLLKDKLNL